ncbi:MAG: methylated-DNA--[protein]-cysteine S-methyltransferase [Cellulosilyticum sp.]|nr:methylated-DNA--[protein]-cysteine S-methyltransferase [Cellulosilyticum sp.]
MSIKERKVYKVKKGYAILDTDLLGEIGIIVSEQGVEKICLTKESFETYLKINPDLKQDEVLCRNAKSQIEEYFRGERLIFDLPLVIEGTEFRKQVWKALTEIPYGETRSYGDIAKAICNPKAVRAVGSANKANAIPLLIPCHRVIGSKGRMVGFMGCRTDLQARLLEHEQRVYRQYQHLCKLSENPYKQN